MEIILFRFNKRKNSTATPIDGTIFPCELKSECSILSPVIDIESAIYPNYNYAYMPAFSRYYYITDISYDAGLWVISMEVDVLATWKEYIQSTKTRVIFSTSKYNSDLLDNRIAASGKYSRNSATADFAGALTGQNTVPSGTFALVALSNDSQWATGTTTTYFMTYQQMQAFASELLEPTVWEGLKQFFNNPMDGVIECYYLPINIASYVSLSENGNIQIGDYTFSATARKALSTNLALSTHKATITIPWGYSDFRRLSPFTDISLFVPFCGAKPIAPEMVYNIDQLFIDYSVDITSGNVQAIVYNKEEVLEEFSGNIKVSLPLAQSQSRVENVIGGSAGAVTAVAGFSTGNVALGATGVLSAISSVLTPTNIKTMGGFGGSVLGAIIGNDLTRWQKFRLSVTTRETSDSPANMRATMGNVLNEVVSLSGLSGYCQTSGASVSAPATELELNDINSMLDSGVYIE